MLAFAVCLVYIAVQTLSAVYNKVYDPYMMFTRYRGHLWIQMMQIMNWIASRIEGHSLIKSCRNLLYYLLNDSRGLKITIIDVLFQILYFVKNISAAVILYLQAKNAKSK